MMSKRSVGVGRSRKIRKQVDWTYVIELEASSSVFPDIVVFK
jgi:hypothetical protein